MAILCSPKHADQLRAKRFLPFEAITRATLVPVIGIPHMQKMQQVQVFLLSVHSKYAVKLRE